MADILRQFMQQMAEGVVRGFINDLPSDFRPYMNKTGLAGAKKILDFLPQSAATKQNSDNTPPPQDTFQNTNTTSSFSELPKNSAQQDSTNTIAKKPTNKLFAQNALSDVVSQALREDGVITLKGDNASVEKKGSRGGFSRMPRQEASQGDSDVDIFQLSKALSSGDDVDPNLIRRSLETLTKDIKDPRERERQRAAIAASMGTEAGTSQAKKRDNAVSEEQVKALKRASSMADVQEAQALGSPEEVIRAFVAARKGRPSAQSLVPKGNMSEFLEDTTLGSLGIGASQRLSPKGEQVAQVLRNMTKLPVDTPEDFVQLLQMLIKAENEI